MGKLSDDIQKLVDRCPVCAGSGVKPGYLCGYQIICMERMCSDLLTIKRRVIELETAAGPSPAACRLADVYSRMRSLGSEQLPEGFSEPGQLACRTTDYKVDDKATAANPDLAMPEGLSELGQAAYRTIIAAATVFKLTHTGGCKAFYSPKEWRERGEAYGLNSELIIVYDGADIGHLCSLDKDEMSGYAHVNAMREALAAVGLFTEECTCWYSAVYKIG